jgi:xanthosine utilization system XapX-like protein
VRYPPEYLLALLAGLCVGVVVTLLPAKSKDGAVVRGLVAFAVTVAAVSVLIGTLWG